MIGGFRKVALFEVCVTQGALRLDLLRVFGRDCLQLLDGLRCVIELVKVHVGELGASL